MKRLAIAASTALLVGCSWFSQNVAPFLPSPSQAGCIDARITQDVQSGMAPADVAADVVTGCNLGQNAMDFVLNLVEQELQLNAYKKAAKADAGSK